MEKVKAFFSIKSLKVLILVIDSIVPLVVIPYGYDYFYYPKIIIIYILLAVSIFIALISVLLGNLKLKACSNTFLLMMFLFFVFLSFAFSPYKAQALWGRPARFEGLITYISYFLIYYLSYLCFEDDKDITMLLKFSFSSACIIAFIGILQYAGLNPIPRDNIRKAWHNTAFSTLGNPNFLGSYLSLIFPATLTFYISGEYEVQCTEFSAAKKTVYGILLLAANILLFTALLVTNTRSAWVGVLLSLLLISILQLIKILLKSRNRRNYINIKPHRFYPQRLAKALCAMALSLIILNSLSNGYVISRFKSIIIDYKTITSINDKSALEKSSIGSERIFIWTRSMDYVFKRPLFGFGPDTFDKVFKMTPEEALHHFGSTNIYVDKAHNEYLQILITLGFPALILYLLFLFEIVFKSVRKLVNNKDNMLTCILLSGILSYIIQAFFNISVVSVAPLYWSFLGVLENSSAGTKKQG